MNARLLACATALPVLLALLPPRAGAIIVTMGNTSPVIAPLANTVVMDLSVATGNPSLGALRVDGGSTLVITDKLSVGANFGAQGEVSLSDAPSIINVGGDSVIGDSGIGAFIQNNGIHNIAGNLVLGQLGDGRYTLSAGFVIVNGTTVVANQGTATFVQLAGTHQTASLLVGQAANSDGSYTLSGGLLNVPGVGNQTRVGVAGTGAFTQNGGSHTVDSLVVGEMATGDGRYTLNQGDLTLQSRTTVGQAGTGDFVQNGGRHTIKNDLFLGKDANSSGSYELNGGTLEILDGQTTVGDAGAGTFTQNGGTHKITGNLVLGDDPGIKGTYKLTGGNLAVTQALTVGNKGDGEFLQSGGSASFGAGTIGAVGGIGTLELDSGAKLSFAGIVSIGGGSAQNKPVGMGSVTVDGNGSTLKATVINVGGAQNSGVGKLSVGNGGVVDSVVNVLKTGTLEGQKGVKDFKNNVNNLGGKVSAAPGPFHIDGAYAQANAGALEILFEGAAQGAVAFGRLDIAGPASFQAGVEMDFVFDQFLPKAGDEYVYLTSSAVQLAASDHNCSQGVFICHAEGLAAGFDFDVRSTSTSLILIALNDAQPVPEPETWLLTGLGLVGLVGLVAWRRRALPI
jgi:hypothetical protein